MPSTKSHRNVVILGMHRSGTSMVARLLERAGFAVGASEQLMAVQKDNPLGFWERRDVVQLNDEILSASGSHWFSARVGDSVAEDAVADDTEARIDSILQQLPQPWLLKDPRLALTWPEWDEPLQDALIIYVYRSPQAVAASLQRRNGFPARFGLALWEYYNRRIAAIVSQRSGLCLSYETFASQTEPAMEDLREQLVAAGALPADAPVLDGGLFESELNHAADAPALSELMTESQRLLAQQLSAAADDHSTLAAVAAPPAELEQQLQDFALLYAAQIERVTELDASRLTSEGLQTDLDAITVDRDGLLAQHHELESSHRALADAHAESNTELDFLRIEQQRIAGLETQLTEGAQHLRESENQLRESEEKADYLFHQLSLEYQRILGYAESAPGLLNALGSRLYKLMRLRPSVRTAFDDVHDNALQHRDSYGAPTQALATSRLALMRQVIGYVLAHPVASLRSFSWHRLRRAGAVFLRSDEQQLGLWVRQRFPATKVSDAASLLPELGDELDDLQLTFPVEEQVRVSIVIPVYNEYRMTVFCLQSLLQNTADVSYEVIVADDASTDRVATIGERVAGIQICRSDNNQGFVRNCNAGAALARGEYLLFLNNDTAFTEGWLSALVAVLDADDKAGIVGPKLVYGNGDLQEAGGIIWDDASGWNFGRLDDAGLPAYNYLKSVDYVSGACLLVRRQLWDEAGGFDLRYVPAYYEDTDLCFTVRELGYEVMYQPASRVFHFEGVSNGVELNSGIKQYQLINQQTFRDKWSETLARDHYPNGEQVFQARDRSRYRRCVLVVDHYVPSFDKDAGSRSTWQYLQLLVDMGYNVKFIGANFFPHEPYTQALQQAGIEVLVGEQMARNLDSWLQEQAADIDAVYIHRPHVAEQFLSSLQRMQPRPRLIFFGHDLHYLRTQRQLEVTGDISLRKEADSWHRREYAVFAAMDRIYYPSQVEVDAILEEQPQLAVRAIPLYVIDDVEPSPYVADEREGMLFVGGFNHPPNEDGINWYIDEVLPLIRAQCPQLRLHIVGSNMPQELQARAGAAVVVHGYLEDEELVRLYQQVKMAVVPLRYGAGVKGKVIEALQHGLPLVTTSIGAEGLPAAEQVLHIADDADAMVQAVLAIEGGQPAVSERLDRYRDYLQTNFARSRAADIIRQDFGSPDRLVE